MITTKLNYAGTGAWTVVIGADVVTLQGAPDFDTDDYACLKYLGEAMQIALSSRGFHTGDAEVVRDGVVLGAIALRAGSVSVAVAKPQGVPR